MMQDYVSRTSINGVEQAQAQVVFLTRRLSELRIELEAERANVPASSDAIQSRIVEAERHLDQLQKQINQARSKSKQHKQEIEEWKQWYGAIAPINKTQAWATLNMEISWRSQEICTCKATISKLETEKLATMSRVEKMHSQWAAFTNGLYDRPLEEDPRWLEIEASLNAAKVALNAASTATKAA